jgi:hypothetical protein
MTRGCGVKGSELCGACDCTITERQDEGVSIAAARRRAAPVPCRQPPQMTSDFVTDPKLHPFVFCFLAPKTCRAGNNASSQICMTRLKRQCCTPMRNCLCACSQRRVARRGNRRVGYQETGPFCMLWATTASRRYTRRAPRGLAWYNRVLRQRVTNLCEGDEGAPTSRRRPLRWSPAVHG